MISYKGPQGGNAGLLPEGKKARLWITGGTLFPWGGDCQTREKALKRGSRLLPLKGHMSKDLNNKRGKREMFHWTVWRNVNYRTYKPSKVRKEMGPKLKFQTGFGSSRGSYQTVVLMGRENEIA